MVRKTTNKEEVIMNNEEKAREIAKKNSEDYSAEDIYGHFYEQTSEPECYFSAKEIAQWKDQEFLKLIDSILDYARSKIEERHDKMDRIKYEGMRKILLELRKDIEK